MKYSLSLFKQSKLSPQGQAQERSRLSSVLPNFRFLPPVQRHRVNELSHLWQYNNYLLMQCITLIKRLQEETSSRFRYAQATGPHIRHIIEHYSAFVDTLKGTSFSVCYDKRQRDIALQSFPDMTLAKLQTIIATLLAQSEKPTWRLNSPLCTTQRMGVKGEFEITVETTLGRELMALVAHTVHHQALLAQIALDAGVDMGEHFGKAPATMAFHR
jgi:uncharacterized damage-inducible protein DinB